MSLTPEQYDSLFGSVCTLDGSMLISQTPDTPPSVLELEQGLMQEQELNNENPLGWSSTTSADFEIIEREEMWYMDAYNNPYIFYGTVGAIGIVSLAAFGYALHRHRQ